jgi:MFS transporter, DHA1 family, multidrug resistance protein
MALTLVSATPPIPLQQLLLAIIAVGVQLVQPVLNLRMLDLFPRARGSAASVQSCVSIMISAAVFGQLVPLLSGSLVILSAGSCLGAVIAFALWRWARHPV